MSLKALSAAFKTIAGGDFRPSASLVLLCLANRHNQETGRCDPSIARIASDTGLSRRAVQCGLRELETKRAIQTVFRKATTGRGLMNMNSRYRIIGSANSAPTPAQNLRPKQEIYPSAFDDLAMSIELEGDEYA